MSETYLWAKAKKSVKLTRGEWISPHLCLRYIQDRWQVNDFQTQEQIDLRFMGMMNRIEDWIKPLSDDEMIRLLEEWLSKKKSDIADAKEKKRLDAIRQEEDSKRWADIYGEIDAHTGLEVIE